MNFYMQLVSGYFNPQGSHEPRPYKLRFWRLSRNFNPQGSHEPRPENGYIEVKNAQISIHKALTSLDCYLRYRPSFGKISIHKALTSLDSIIGLFPSGNCDFNPQGSHEPRQQKYTIILVSMPNLYILIIHLQQIIQQVKKFSRILILFSGRLQCESPWNFMCNYYSHQSFLTKNQPSFKLPPLSICAKFSRTILNNHLKWRSQLTVYPAVYYVLSRSKNSNVLI